MRAVRIGFCCIAISILIVCLGGCRSSSPPAPPAMVTSAGLFVGTPVSGPVEGEVDVSGSLASRVDVRWVAMQVMPGAALGPVNARSRLIIAPDSDSALPTSGDLTRHVRFGSGDTAAAFVDDLAAGRLGPTGEIAADSQLIIPGATAQFSIEPPGGSAEGGTRLLVSPMASGPAATQPAEATVGARVAVRASSGTSAAPGRVISETAVIDGVRFSDGLSFVVVFPVERSKGPWTAIAAVAKVNLSPVDPVAVKQLQADVKRASEEVRAGWTRSPQGDGLTLRSALDALQSSDSVRPAVLLLTTLSEARIASDMVLVADDGQLSRMADEIHRFANADIIPSVADLRWFMDRYAIQVMCEAAEKDELSAELQSVLALHAGDVARRPDVIVELLKQVGNSDALAERLVAENLIALEDSSPAARMRAYDWLVARDRAPAEFDPLADAKARRAAIDNAMNAPGGQP